VLAGASPYDTKWGIGLARDDPRAKQRHLWRGTNYLGEILTQVRDEMIADGDHVNDAMVCRFTIHCVICFVFVGDWCQRLFQMQLKGVLVVV